jgi:hypothetical protein
MDEHVVDRDKRQRDWRQAIDDEQFINDQLLCSSQFGRVNQVETKEASCNTSTFDCTRSFRIGTDPSYSHAAINHRDTEVIIKTLEKSSKEYNKMSRLAKISFKDECKETSSKCITCLAVSNRQKGLRRRWSIKRTPQNIRSIQVQDEHNEVAKSVKRNSKTSLINSLRPRLK